MTLGENIRKARNDRGLSIAILSIKSGVPYYTIRNWEIGVCFPSVMNLIDVADALNISLDELVGRSRG